MGEGLGTIPRISVALGSLAACARWDSLSRLLTKQAISFRKLSPHRDGWSEATDEEGFQGK